MTSVMELSEIEIKLSRIELSIAQMENQLESLIIFAETVQSAVANAQSNPMVKVLMRNSGGNE